MLIDCYIRGGSGDRPDVTVDFDTPPLPGDIVYIQDRMFQVDLRWHRLMEREERTVAGTIRRRIHVMHIGIRQVVADPGAEAPQLSS